MYRASSEAELGQLAKLASEQGLDELVWVLIYREGLVALAELAARFGRREDELRASLDSLTADGRVHRLSDGRFEAVDFSILRGATVGWEAAVFDHVQAVVQTISQRLRLLSARKEKEDVADGPPHDPATFGGSTYSFDLGPEHPLAAEVKGQLEAVRQRLGALRERVDAHISAAGLPAKYQQVVTYIGQCILERDREYGRDDDQS